jgi:hypothetical protein
MSDDDTARRDRDAIRWLMELEVQLGRAAARSHGDRDFGGAEDFDVQREHAQHARARLTFLRSLGERK